MKEYIEQSLIPRYRDTDTGEVFAYRIETSSTIHNEDGNYEFRCNWVWELDEDWTLNYNSYIKENNND